VWSWAPPLERGEQLEHIDQQEAKSCSDSESDGEHVDLFHNSSDEELDLTAFIKYDVGARRY